MGGICQKALYEVIQICLNRLIPSKISNLAFYQWNIDISPRLAVGLIH